MSAVVRRLPASAESGPVFAEPVEVASEAVDEEADATTFERLSC